VEALPPSWRDLAQRWIDRWRPTKPILVYRPLVERPHEWAGASSQPEQPEKEKLGGGAVVAPIAVAGETAPPVPLDIGV
jgi:hypothetical protein